MTNKQEDLKAVWTYSDRGVQYTSGQFKKMADRYGFIQSMSRRGDCWDNGCAETFFKTLRAELIRGRIYRSKGGSQGRDIRIRGGLQ